MEKANIAINLLNRHQVDPFVGQALGAALGNLIERGLSNAEIESVVQDLVVTIRKVLADPEQLADFERLISHGDGT